MSAARMAASLRSTRSVAKAALSNREGRMDHRLSAHSTPLARGRPFLRGESGNPAGRPMGARHKATVAAEALLDGEAEALTRKAVEMAARRRRHGPALMPRPHYT